MGAFSESKAAASKLVSIMVKPRFAWQVRVVVYGVLLGSVFAFLGYCVWMPGASAPDYARADVDLARAESLRQTVNRVVELGPRNLHHPQGYQKAQSYLEDSLNELARRAPESEKVSSPQGDAYNLYVEWGSPLTDEVVVVGAHYDTAFDTPGGNDNGSGVAIALDLVGRFTAKPPTGALRIVLFANEEPPHFWEDSMGSLVHAKGCRARGERLKGMISLESLGFYSDEPKSQRYPFPIGLFYPGRGNFVAFVGNLSSRHLAVEGLSLFREAVRFPSEGGAFPSGMPGVGWSDHSAFWQVGYPAIMLTDTAPFRDKHYHLESDTGAQIDYQRLAVVAEGVEHVIRVLAAK